LGGLISRPQSVLIASHEAANRERIVPGASSPALCLFANAKASGTWSLSLQTGTCGVRRPMRVSAIARAVTGTAWSGPRFFGLRSGEEPAISSAKADEWPPGFTHELFVCEWAVDFGCVEECDAALTADRRSEIISCLSAAGPKPKLIPSIGDDGGDP
jgi:hypothetical protein